MSRANAAIAHRKHTEVRILEARPLVTSDLVDLQAPATVTQIRGIRDSHHRLALILAAGATNIEAAEKCGMSTGRIIQLRRDPTFVELLDSYRAEIRESRLESIDELNRLAVQNLVKMERQIGDQLDDADEAGEKIPLQHLLRGTADRMDRFGYGKHNTTTNINLDFAKRLEAAISRSRRIEQ